MPGIAPPVGNPYPTIGSVMNVARARVNDMINDADGDLLTNEAPYSQTYLSAAWRWLQRRCATAGVETAINEVVLYDLPAQGSQDPADQAYVAWLGCSDGVNQMEAPRLPMELIYPLSVWRRQACTQNAFGLMSQARDGLPPWFDFNVYDWRHDGLYFYAPTYSQDLKIRYSAYLRDLDITLVGQEVPIMMCEDALGARVAFEFASARGSAQATQMETWANNAFDTIAQGSSRRKQRQSLRRIPYNRGRY